jgi:hypothetical protein
VCDYLIFDAWTLLMLKWMQVIVEERGCMHWCHHYDRCRFILVAHDRPLASIHSVQVGVLHTLSLCMPWAVTSFGIGPCPGLIPATYLVVTLRKAESLTGCGTRYAENGVLPPLSLRRSSVWDDAAREPGRSELNFARLQPWILRGWRMDGHGMTDIYC